MQNCCSLEVVPLSGVEEGYASPVMGCAALLAGVFMKVGVGETSKLAFSPSFHLCCKKGGLKHTVLQGTLTTHVCWGDGTSACLLSFPQSAIKGVKLFPEGG